MDYHYQECVRTFACDTKTSMAGSTSPSMESIEPKVESRLCLKMVDARSSVILTDKSALSRLPFEPIDGAWWGDVPSSAAAASAAAASSSSFAASSLIAASGENVRGGWGRWEVAGGRWEVRQVQ